MQERYKKILRAGIKRDLDEYHKTVPDCSIDSMARQIETATGYSIKEVAVAMVYYAINSMVIQDATTDVMTRLDGMIQDGVDPKAALMQATRASVSD